MPKRTAKFTAPNVAKIAGLWLGRNVLGVFVHYSDKAGRYHISEARDFQPKEFLAVMASALAQAKAGKSKRKASR